MKTKLTFLIITIAALFGVGMLMAFKQETVKKYALVRTTYFASNLSQTKIVIYKDGISKEHLVESDRKESEADIYKKNWEVIINNVINDGYELKGTNSVINPNSLYVYTEYIFEKE